MTDIPGTLYATALVMYVPVRVYRVGTRLVHRSAVGFSNLVSPVSLRSRHMDAVQLDTGPALRDAC